MILLSLPVGDAFAAAQVRLLHAVPGGPPAELQVSAARQVRLAGVGFGEANEYVTVPAGSVRLALVAGGKRIAGRSSSFGDGARHTVVATTKRGASAPELRVYRDGRAAPGKARLRVVSAAPEVARAELQLDGRRLGSLAAGEVARYSERDPGTYRLAALKPGGDAELAALPALNLVAGTAASAYVIGSAGERTRFVVLQDAAAAPGTGPATGLGGLTDGGASWPLALLAAAMTGAVVLITDLLYQGTTVAIVAAALALFFVGLWFGWPVKRLLDSH